MDRKSVFSRRKGEMERRKGEMERRKGEEPGSKGGRKGNGKEAAARGTMQRRWTTRENMNIMLFLTLFLYI